MIQFQYDEKTYRRMIIRLSWWVYAIIFGIILAVAAWISGMYISDYLNGERELTNTLIMLVIFAVFLAALVIVMVVSIRKQLAKNFAMYSENGVIDQVVEITDEEIIITNLSRHNVTKLLRRDIASVKRYKGFFVINTNTKVKMAVPFAGQSQLLYDVLMGAVGIEVLPAKPKDTETDNASAEQKVVKQPDKHTQSNALSIEYELTETQAINMLIKVTGARLRVLLASIIIFAVFTVLYLVVTVGSYLTDDSMAIPDLIFTVVFAIATVCSTVIYCNKNKSGRNSGVNYFRQQSKDGKCILRIELYDKGIVSVNTLLETRTYLRIVDMELVKLLPDFFYVQFKSKEVLPIPLTEDTKKLYDILSNGVRQSRR